MGGGANVEEHMFNKPTGISRGVALRAFDPKTGQWAIWWIDSRDPLAALDPPVKGRFDNGVGTFYSDGALNGKPIRTRFIWSHITPTSARWEQAYSSDAGKTWETNWIMEFRRASFSSATCCPIVELRQYTLHPGQRDVLIDLFDREFIETQEAEGMRILGQFRDLDNPNRFVWLRGFSDMPGRAHALGAFYGGPAWKAHSKAANATMVDSSNVLLLRPTRPTSGFALEKLQRTARGSTDVPERLVIGTIYYFDQSPTNEFVDFFEREVTPILRDAGASIIGQFVTESSPNTFPALPLREGEQVFVFFSAFRDETAYEQYLAKLGRSRGWNGGTMKALSTRIKGPPEILRLSPTARSLVGR
jgi:quinol monooxygenase YgiN